MLGYDSDDDSRRSPYTLEQVHPRITPPDSPAPPDPPRSNNPSMPAGHQTQQPGRPGQKSARARRRRHLPSQGDQVLLLASYPNRPDIAREAGQKVLLSDSDNDDGDDDAEHSEGAGGPSRGPVARSPSPGVPTRTSTTATLNPLFNAMNAMGSSSSFDERDGAPESAWAKGKAGVEGATGMERSQDGEPPRKRTSISDKTPIRNLKQSDSIAASPALQPFLLSGPRGASGMQMLTESPTPSRTSTMPVEPAQQMLPSVKSLIHEVDSNEQHGAYARPRATSLTSVKAILEPAAMIVSSQTAPLPVAPIQAANQRIRSQTESLPQTDPRLYRPPSSAGQKRPYQNHQQRGSVSSTGSTLMPHASSVTTVSPSATTPSLIRDASPQTSPTDDGRRRSGDDAQSAGPNTLTYKCHYPGCTAAPFLTQYLLKYVSTPLVCPENQLTENRAAHTRTSTPKTAPTTAPSPAARAPKAARASSGATRCCGTAWCTTRRASYVRSAATAASTGTRARTICCATCACTIRTRALMMIGCALCLCSGGLGLLVLAVGAEGEDDGIVWLGMRVLSRVWERHAEEGRVRG